MRGLLQPQMSRFLRLWLYRLGVGLLCLSFEAYASSITMNLPVGAQYFKTCEGLMESVANGDKDAFLLALVKNDEEAYQLLADYGAILSKEFHAAVMAALDKRGIVPMSEDKGSENKGSDEYSKMKLRESARYISQVEALFDLPDEKFNKFVWEVFELLPVAGSGHWKAAAGRVKHQMFSNLNSAIKKSPEKERFERLMGLTIRGALLLTVKHAITANKPIRKSTDDGVGMGLGFLVGIAGAVAITWLSEDIGATLGSVIGFFTAWFGAFAGGVIASSGEYVAEFEQSSLKGTKVIAATKLRDGRDREFERSVRSLFDNYMEWAHIEIVDLSKLCNTRPQRLNTDAVCDLTPVQLMYAGHLDLIELEVVAEALNLDLNNVANLAGLADARKTVDKLLENPTSFQAQLAMRSRLMIFMRDYQIAKDRLVEGVKTLKAKVDSLQRRVKALRDQPYKQLSADTSPELMNKSMLLMAQLQTDLGTIEKLNVSQDKLLAVAENGHEDIIEQLTKVLDATQSMDSDWEKVAEELGFLLDSLGVPFQ